MRQLRARDRRVFTRSATGTWSGFCSQQFVSRSVDSSKPAFRCLIALLAQVAANPGACGFSSVCIIRSFHPFIYVIWIHTRVHHFRFDLSSWSAKLEYQKKKRKRTNKGVKERGINSHMIVIFLYNCNQIANFTSVTFAIDTL